jgi:serine/threonine-protein kinase
MDLAPGGDLARRLRAGPLPLPEAARVVAGLARGLAHVHARGVLHRDIKPANVLFDEADRPLLVDFGIARLEGAQALTRTGALLGTPAYLAPEQADGKNDQVDARTDVYGLGAVLYECLTGLTPFDAPTPHLMVLRVLAGRPTPPSAHVPTLPRVADAVCLRALAFDKRDRFPDAASFGAAVEALVAAPAPPPRRAPRVLAVVAVLGLLAAATSLGLARRPDARPAPPAPAPATPAPPAPTPRTAPPRPSLPAGLAWHGDEVVNELDGSVLVWVPPGVFTMGYPKSLRTYNDNPEHEVELSGYWIGKYEVTWAQFRAYCAATGAPLPPLPPALAKVDVSRHPVVNVTWDEARAYCAWAGLRLPTEAEWERAARGTDGRLFPWGDEAPSPERLNGHDDALPATAPVGSYPLGASATGCLDMAGNAWEWVEDTYDVFFYQFGPRRDPCSRAAQGEHLVRGGGYDCKADLVYAPLRWNVPGDARDSARGLRAARDGPGPGAPR